MAGVILGNRIPVEYFVTSGKGEASVGSEGLPYETGSYDAALNDAGIENANIVKYTSLVPPGCARVSRAAGLRGLRWGEVLESIMAQANGAKGAHIAAAVMVTDVYDQHDRHLGGFACEYSGRGSRKEALRSLMGSVSGMVERRGLGNVRGQLQEKKKAATDKGFRIVPAAIFEYESMTVKESHGTVLAALCYIKHMYPSTYVAAACKRSSTRRRKLSGGR